MKSSSEQSIARRKQRTGVFASIQNKQIEERRKIERKFSTLIHLSKIFWILLVMMIIGIGVYLLVFQTSSFKVKTITTNIDSLKFAPKNELEKFVDPINSQNIFLVFPSNIEKDILNKFPEIVNVKVDKKLPDTITINFTETSFAYDVVNLKKSYLINQNGQVVNVASVLDSGITNDEVNIVNKNYDINQISITPEEIEKLAKNGKTENIDDKIKNFKLAKFQDLQLSSYNSLIDKLKKIQVDNKSLPVVYLLNSSEIQVGREVFPRSVSKILSYNTLLKYSRFVSPVLVQLDTNFFMIYSEGKFYIFDPDVSTDSQIVRLEAVLSQLKKENSDFHVIDVTSEKVSVI